MTSQLMEGSGAIAEAMIAAGCRFFAGYPMTPFTEVLEHMAKRLPVVGGACVNAESELEAIGMAWGAAATGTRAATGSTGQGLSLMQESIAEAAMAHLPLVILNMARAQGDYFQATRGGGHGDYRTPVLAPMDVAEATQLAQLAFHIADTWRNPVVFFGDYYLAHTYQSVQARLAPRRHKAARQCRLRPLRLLHACRGQDHSDDRGARPACRHRALRRCRPGRGCVRYRREVRPLCR